MAGVRVSADLHQCCAVSGRSRRKKHCDGRAGVSIILNARYSMARPFGLEFEWLNETMPSGLTESDVNWCVGLVRLSDDGKPIVSRLSETGRRQNE